MVKRISSCQAQENKARTECGNALIYVLIAIALFAALSFTLARQTNNNQEAGTLRPEEVELAASRVLGYAAQAQSAIDQMFYTNTTIAELDFTLPGQAGFNTAPHVDKVFHPGGGGLTPGRLDPKVIAETSTNPPAGWYAGRFNNVEWTPSTGTDVLLVAHQINAEICADLNLKITGSTAIPALSTGLNVALIDGQFHSSSNADFEVSDCPLCEGYSTLCVSDAGATTYSFYNIVAGR